MKVLKKLQKKYLKAFLGKSKNIDNVLSIYDTDKNKVSYDNINSNSKIISIIEINYLNLIILLHYIDYCIRQTMLFKETPMFTKCIIKLNTNENNLEEKKKIIIKIVKMIMIRKMNLMKTKTTMIKKI